MPYKDMMSILYSKWNWYGRAIPKACAVKDFLDEYEKWITFKNEAIYNKAISDFLLKEEYE